ncbi:MAG TPA: S26 family signal peptidase, partial [Oscillospiraceae bacterium]|nr:S26 family signal peptidase [Oscillospiraceae bacterium]
MLKSSHEKIKKQMEPPEPLTKKSFFREWVLPLGTEVLVLFVLLKFIFMINFVPTESMWPTFPAHSALFSTRVFYKENIERGDVLVFRSDETGKVLINPYLQVATRDFPAILDVKQAPYNWAIDAAGGVAIMPEAAHPLGRTYPKGFFRPEDQSKRKPGTR